MFDFTITILNLKNQALLYNPKIDMLQFPPLG